MAEKGVVATSTLKYLMKQAMYFNNYNCAKRIASLMGRELEKSEIKQLMLNYLKEPCGIISALSLATNEKGRISKRMLKLLMAYALKSDINYIAEETAALLGRRLNKHEVDQLLKKSIEKGKPGLSGALFTARLGDGASKKMLEMLLKEYEEMKNIEGDIWNNHIAQTRIMLGKVQ